MSNNPRRRFSNVIHEWQANVSCKEFELGGSFAVFIFLGQVPADSSQWITSPDFAGIFDVFTDITPDPDHPDRMVDGFVFLNQVILKHSGQTSLEPEFVVPYIRGKLHWGIKTADGRVPPLRELSSLEVTVCEVPMTYEPGSEFPTPGKPTYYPEITRGQQGGHRDT